MNESISLVPTERREPGPSLDPKARWPEKPQQQPGRQGDQQMKETTNQGVECAYKPKKNMTISVFLNRNTHFKYFCAF